MGPPNVLGLPKPASSISTSRTFGDPSGGSGCPIRFQSGFDPSSVLLATPPNGGLRIGSLVRSGSLIVPHIPSLNRSRGVPFVLATASVHPPWLVAHAAVLGGFQVGAAAVGAQPVQPGHVYCDDRQGPERVGGDEEHLVDR